MEQIFRQKEIVEQSDDVGLYYLELKVCQDKWVHYQAMLRETPRGYLFLIRGKPVWMPSRFCYTHETRKIVSIPFWLFENIKEQWSTM